MLPKTILNKIKQVAFDSYIKDENKCTTKWNKHVNQVAPPEFFEARRVYHRNRLACVFSRNGVTKKWSALEHTYSTFEQAQQDGWVLITDLRTPSPKLSDFLKK